MVTGALERHGRLWRRWWEGIRVGGVEGRLRFACLPGNNRDRSQQPTVGVFAQARDDASKAEAEVGEQAGAGAVVFETQDGEATAQVVAAVGRHRLTTIGIAGA